MSHARNYSEILAHRLGDNFATPHQLRKEYKGVDFEDEVNLEKHPDMVKSKNL